MDRAGAATAGRAQAALPGMEEATVPGFETEAALLLQDARRVCAYWMRATGTRVHSAAIGAKIAARLVARLREGFSVRDLCLCVDAAKANAFYVERHYHKKPDVIWRNGERVFSLLADVEPDARDEERERRAAAARQARPHMRRRLEEITARKRGRR